MLVGFFFDWFIVFCVGAIWALTLSRKPSAPAPTRFWAWIIGGLYFLCWLAGAKGMADVMNAPPPVFGEVYQAPPGAELIRNARLGVRLVISGGLIWLVVLTVQAFTSEGEDEQKPAADA